MYGKMLEFKADLIYNDIRKIDVAPVHPMRSSGIIGEKSILSKDVMEMVRVANKEKKMEKL